MNHTISKVTLIFSVYGPPGPYSVVFFIFMLVIYVSILLVNILLVLVICVEPSLHRPMYILLINLAVNGIIGSTSVCPKIMQYLLVEMHESSLAGCLAKSFFINVYASCAYCILALMAFDRYVSICKPLHYHSIMAPSKLRFLLALTYFMPILFSAVQVYMTSRLELCKHIVDKLLCDNLAIVNLSCKRSVVIDLLSSCFMVLFVCMPILFVFLSYINIILVCLKTSSVSQKKALRTCTPHLVTFINFSVVSFFGAIFNRLSLSLPRAMNIFSSLSFFVIPALLNPIIYGIKTREIWTSLVRLMKKKVVQL